MRKRIRTINEIKFLIATLFILIPTSIVYLVYYINHQFILKAIISGFHTVIGIVVLPMLLKGRGNLVLVRFVFGLILSTGLMSMIATNFQSGTELSWFIPMPLYFFAASGYKQGLKWNVFSYILVLSYYVWLTMFDRSLLIDHPLNLNAMFSNFIVFVTSGYFAYRVESTHSVLEDQASRDSLTGILNRVGFRDLVENLIFSQRENHKYVFSLLLIDIDHFKAVNDNYGHVVGDKLLINFSDLIRNTIRKNDIFARWGGEEFIIFFDGSTLDEAKIVSEKLRKAIEKEEFIFPEATINITASFGLAEYDHGQTFEYMFNAADKALYYSKKNGRNLVNCYSESEGVVY